jgi:uncharacterized protein (UPF0248 family)
MKMSIGADGLKVFSKLRFFYKDNADNISSSIVEFKRDALIADGSVRENAEDAMFEIIDIVGVWIKNKFIPYHRIISVEIVEEKRNKAKNRPQSGTKMPTQNDSENKKPKRKRRGRNSKKPINAPQKGTPSNQPSVKKENQSS